jgi:hypothetical protein
VLAADHSEEQRAHKVLADARAESLDAARKVWWLGLRDAEQEHDRALGHNFELDEDVYRPAFYFGPAPRMPRQVDRRGDRLLEVVVFGYLGFRATGEALRAPAG